MCVYIDILEHLADVQSIHILMAVAATQEADQHIRSSVGAQYLAQGHFDLQTRGI